MNNLRAMSVQLQGAVLKQGIHHSFIYNHSPQKKNSHIKGKLPQDVYLESIFVYNLLKFEEGYVPQRNPISGGKFFLERRISFRVHFKKTEANVLLIAHSKYCKPGEKKMKHMKQTYYQWINAFRLEKRKNIAHIQNKI